jgi:Heterokaryon incompatibility protein (HET)
MESITPSYKPFDYASVPLPHEHSIRVLSIQPSDQDETTIDCVLQAVNLDDEPPYCALSYTWGPPYELEFSSNQENGQQSQDNRWILVNGDPLGVTPNLYDGLLQLRRSMCQRNGSLRDPLYRLFQNREEVALLWVDAICINQMHEGERSAQVNMMSRIYSSALVVLAWLGPATNAAAVAADLRTLAQVYLKHENDLYEGRMRCDADGENNVKYLKQFDLSNWKPWQWEAVRHFYRNRWFNRVWVCQEVALAREIVILCGDQAIPWQFIANTASFFIWTGLLSSAPGTHALEARVRFSGMGQTSGLEIMRFKCQSKEYNGRTTRSNALMFEELLHSTSFCAAIDPRDKVFALLGILERQIQLNRAEELTLCADYRLTAAQVYHQTTVLHISESKSLNLLSFVQPVDAISRVQLNDRRINGQGGCLPSWVPDFSRYWSRHVEVPRKHRGTRPFNASGDLSAKLEARFEQMSLRLSATKIDIVRSLGPLLDELTAGRGFEKAAKVVGGAPSVYFNGQSRIEAWWRSSIADMRRDEYPAPTKLEISFSACLLDALLRRLCSYAEGKCSSSEWSILISSYHELTQMDSRNVLPPLSALAPFANVIAQNPGVWFKVVAASETRNAAQDYENACGRCLLKLIFSTSKGYIGNGPATLRENDEIWIIKGSDVPLAVRRLPDLAENGETQYHLLGEAYIHGAMHGEAFADEEPRWKTLCLV